jgi:uncharacterized membrane protein YozB (DUF420 family)
VKALFTYQVLPGYQQIAFINLILQVAILVMLAVALWFKSKRMYRKHGTLMLVAVVMHLILFLLVMGPSFLSLFGASVIAQSSDRLSIVTLTHAILGSVSIVLGVFLVAAWHLQSSTEGCIRRKQIMRITITLWTTALLMGIILYTILYPNILP